jgi:cell division protein FtsL
MTAVAIPARVRSAPARSRSGARPRTGRRLLLVETPERVRGRRRSVAGVVSVAVLALFTIVAFHALTAQSQVTVDRLERQTAVAQRRYERARYEHATLASPERIVQRAAELGLVPPAGPPTAIPMAGDVPEPPDGTASTLHGWTEVKPTLADAP